ncbi:MAG: MFS transporter [Moraxella sp.]|nr:MFS transporter [Moraxella sp.]
MDKPTPTLLSSKTPLWLVLAGLVVLAIIMRSPIVVLGSLAPLLKQTLAVSDELIGWLGAMPMPAFAMGSLMSPFLARRVGLENALLVMIVLMTVSVSGRVAGGVWTLFVGTAVMAVAIGFANTLAAPLIKKHSPQHIALATGLFSLCMSVFAGLSAWVVIPVVSWTSWQFGMGLWAVFGVVAFGLWAWVGKFKPVINNTQSTHLHTTHPNNAHNHHSNGNTHTPFNAWRNINAWCLAVFMGLQSLLFYTVAAFLPSIGTAKGLSLATATELAMTYQLVAPFAIIGMTWGIKRGVSVPAVAVVCAVFNFVGVLGINYLPAYLHLWSALIGFGGAAIFTLSLMLFSLRTYSSDTARDVSGMVQAIGYSIAFFGPLLMGGLYAHYQDWQMPLNVLATLMAINIVAAYFATREYMFG